VYSSPPSFFADLVLGMGRLALLGELPRLLDPAFPRHPSLEFLEGLVDPRHLFRRPGGDLVEVPVAEPMQQLLENRPYPLDKLEIVRPVAPRRREPRGP